MRFKLNCALVSSFLFVYAVLAQSLYGNWAGGVFEKGDIEELAVPVTYARGTFVVPAPSDDSEVGSGFFIGVGLSLACKSALLGAGIDVVKTDNGVSVSAFGQLWPHVFQPNPLPQSLIISPGHTLTITVYQTDSLVDGFFSIENLNTGKSWSDTLVNDPDFPLCLQNAFWIVGIIPDGHTSFANFGTVLFTNLLVKLGNKRTEPRDELVVLNIEQNNRTMTSAQVGSLFDITVTYSPTPT